MRRALCFFVVPLFILISINENARGCSCGGGGTPCVAYGGAAAVFTGSVIAVRNAERPKERLDDGDYWAPVTFKFSVEQSFLGIEGREVEVSTGMGGGDCGYGFKIGGRYLVYAYQYGKDNRLTTSICTRTRPVAKAEEDLEFLRNLSTMAPGVTVYGLVKRLRDEVAKGDRTPVGPLANVSLAVEGEGFRKEVRTDGEGRYRLSGLSPGKLKITLALPDELTTPQTEEEITLGDRGCGAVNFYVVDNGRVSGTVLDAQGQPAARVLITLAEAENFDPLKYSNKMLRTDEQGRYIFSGVPPGRYLLGVNLNRFPEMNDVSNAFPRTFYPGVAAVSEAEVITLGAGEALRVKDLHLPDRRAPSVINAKVVWNDGEPVAKAGISFRDVTYHDARLNYGMSADEQGYFTIKGYVGQTFVIEASGANGRSEPLRITLANPTEVVKIVVSRTR